MTVCLLIKMSCSLRWVVHLLVQVLCSSGMNISGVRSAGHSSKCAAAAETPLFGAAAAGATGLIRVLAGHGANLDHQDDCGETALIRACGR